MKQSAVKGAHRTYTQRTDIQMGKLYIYTVTIRVFKCTLVSTHCNYSCILGYITLKVVAI
jgi:hypothetical protein